MFVTAGDEGFSHQTSLPLMLVANSDPNWRERYWFSVQDIRNRSLILSGGFGKYPNKDVMEACAMLRHGDRQWNVRASRQLLPDPTAIAVGPFAVEVVEPFRHLRFRLAENASRVSFDLHWRADTPAMLEERHFEVNRARVTHDIVRYVQLGRIEGVIGIEDESFDLTLETGWAERDHSWGIRPMAPVPGDPPVASAEWNFLAFCPLQFPSFVLHIYLFEAQAGEPTHLSALVRRRDGRHGDDQVVVIDHDLEWDHSMPVRTLVGGRLILRFRSGRSLDIDLQALAPRVYLQGGGYGVDQGNWKGESHLEYEMWNLADLDRLRDYNRGASDHMVEARCEGETGYGVIEYIVRSGHRKYHRPGGSR
nr:hypothetical protein [Mesorhizobium sp.]